MSDTQQTSKSQALQPPYLTTSRFANLLDALSTRNFSKLDNSILENYGLKGTDRYVAMGTLRFLGIIDEAGNATETMRRLQRKGEDRTAELNAILRQAYSKFFEFNQNPDWNDPDQLHNDFLTVYGVSPRIASSAVRFFVWLAEQAGLKEPSSVRSTERSGEKRPLTRRTVAKQENPRAPKETSSAVTGVLRIPFHGGVVLEIPSDSRLGTILASTIYQEASADIAKLADAIVAPAGLTPEGEAGITTESKSQS